MTRGAWATLLVLALHAGGVVGQGREGRPPEYAVDYGGNRVVRRDGTGKVRWAVKLQGLFDRHRPPHLVWDAGRAYVSHGDGVTALDADTGKAVWHAKGPQDRLLLSGDLLLASGTVGSRPAREECWLVARSVATGKEVFKTGLPPGLDPLPLREVAGLFLVQGWDDPGGRGDALLIGRKGKVCHSLDRQVVAGLRRGDDYILLTSRDVVRLSPVGTERWAVPLDRRWTAGGGLVELPGGEVVAFLFGLISDSGVQLVRFDPASGKVAWRAFCDRLGVTHSEYDHNATAVVEGGRLRVTSRASGGRFTEVRDLRSGRLLRRTQRIDEAYACP